GVLITSYANIVDIVQGPRMALVIDPGDGAYPEKFTLADPAGLPVGAAEAVTTNALSVEPAAAARSASARESTVAAADGARLADEARCHACHEISEPSLGPPYIAIAARHASNKEVMA